MLLSTRYKIAQIMTNPPTLKIGDETIEISSNEKRLGINIDNVLSWTTQIENTIKKCKTLPYEKFNRIPLVVQLDKDRSQCGI